MVNYNYSQNIRYNDLIVVIRSVGERTEAACRNLLSQKVPEDQIITVSNAPFSATLADSYRVGIERGLQWTLCIDADVLVRPDAISKLLTMARDLPPEVCEIQGMVLDKFFGVPRPAGNHLYRTSLLPKALELLLQDEKNIRPEFYTLNRMVELGHPWVEVPFVMGLHDHEQYYKDIFRKSYVLARKFQDHIHLLVEYWRRMVQNDNDYKVALYGLASGISDGSNVHVDIRHNYGFSKWMDTEEWKEKCSLEHSQITPEWIKRTLAEWKSPGGELYKLGAYNMQKIISHGNSQPIESRNLRKMKRKVGGVMMIPWLTGRFLRWAGDRLMSLIKNTGE
jgi:hypothetical protein